VTPLLPIRTKCSCPGVIAFGRHGDVARPMVQGECERTDKEAQLQVRSDGDSEAIGTASYAGGRVEMGLSSNGRDGTVRRRKQVKGRERAMGKGS